MNAIYLVKDYLAGAFSERKEYLLSEKKEFLDMARDYCLLGMAVKAVSLHVQQAASVVLAQCALILGGIGIGIVLYQGFWCFRSASPKLVSVEGEQESSEEDNSEASIPQPLVPASNDELPVLPTEFLQQDRSNENLREPQPTFPLVPQYTARNLQRVQQPVSFILEGTAWKVDLLFRNSELNILLRKNGRPVTAFALQRKAIPLFLNAMQDPLLIEQFCSNQSFPLVEFLQNRSNENLREPQPTFPLVPQYTAPNVQRVQQPVSFILEGTLWKVDLLFRNSELNILLRKNERPVTAFALQRKAIPLFLNAMQDRLLIEKLLSDPLEAIEYLQKQLIANEEPNRDMANLALEDFSSKKVDISQPSWLYYLLVLLPLIFMIGGWYFDDFFEEIDERDPIRSLNVSRCSLEDESQLALLANQVESLASTSFILFKNVSQGISQTVQLFSAVKIIEAAFMSEKGRWFLDGLKKALLKREPARQASFSLKPLLSNAEDPQFSLDGICLEPNRTATFFKEIPAQEIASYHHWIFDWLVGLFDGSKEAVITTAFTAAGITTSIWSWMQYFFSSPANRAVTYVPLNRMNPNWPRDMRRLLNQNP